MYGFSICYIVILINSKMTSRNGSLSLYLTMATVNVIEKEVLGKRCCKKKKKNAGYQHFLLFQRCSLPCDRQHSARWI